MKKLLIVGYGNHIKKNILPAIGRSKKISIVGALVRNKKKYNNEEIKVYSKSELFKIDYDSVFIATPISTHFNLIEYFVNLKKFIICEKPLTLNYHQTYKILGKSRKSRIKLFESSMYRYHKQYKELLKIINKNSSDIQEVSSVFSIPALSKNDIRYKKSLGGGGLLDVGFYPISIMVSLFGMPISIKAQGIRNTEYEVCLKGSALLKYKKFIATVRWGINSKYENNFTFSNSTETYSFDRVFSKPYDYETDYTIKDAKNKITRHKIGKDDHFVNMLESFLFHKSQINDKYNTLNISKVISKIDSQI